MKKQDILTLIDKLDEVINSTTTNHSNEDLLKLTSIKDDLTSKTNNILDPNEILSIISLIIEIMKNGSDFF